MFRNGWFSLSILLFVVMVMPVRPQANTLIDKAISIELLATNRNDIERLFGKPTSGKYSDMFDFPEVQVFVLYSAGPCKPGRSSGWNVSEYTVTGISLSFRPPIKSKALPFSLKSGFRNYPIFDSRKGKVYENDEKGIEVVMNSNGRVESISLDPKKEDSSKHCKKSS